MTRISSIMVVLLSITLAGCGGKDNQTPITISSTAITTAVVGKEYRYDITVAPASARNYTIETGGPSFPEWLELKTEASLPVNVGNVTGVIDNLAADGEDIYFSGQRLKSAGAELPMAIYKTPIDSTAAPQAVLTFSNSVTAIGGLAIKDRILYFSTISSINYSTIHKLNLAISGSQAEVIREVPGYIDSIAIKDDKLFWTDGTNSVKQISLSNPDYIWDTRQEQDTRIFALGLDGYDRVFAAANNIRLASYSDDATLLYDMDEVPCLKGIAGYTNWGTYFASTNCLRNNEQIPGNLRFVAVDGESTHVAGATYFKPGEVLDGPASAVTATDSGRVVWASAVQHTLRTFSVQKNTLVGTPTEARSYDISLRLSSGKSQTFTLVVTNPPVTYEVAGTINNLQGVLQLSNNGTDILPISNGQAGNSSFSFSQELEQGADYNVAVAVNPTGQTCTLNGSASGTIGTTDVEVTVDCEFNTYAIGGTVSGLDGTLGVRLNSEQGQEDLSIYENGDFAFAADFIEGNTYSVTIETQPAGQECELNNSFLNKDGEPVTPTVSGPVSLSISCEDVPVEEQPAEERTLSVTVEGLPSGTIPLRAWGPEDARWAQEDKAFSLGTGSFNNTMRDGETFDIGKIADPDGYNCSITAESPLSGDIDGLGTVNGNVTITFTCVASGGGGGEIPAPEDPFPI